MMQHIMVTNKNVIKTKYSNDFDICSDEHRKFVSFVV